MERWPARHRGLPIRFGAFSLLPALLLWGAASPAAERVPPPPDMVYVPAGETRIGADNGRADEQPSFVARIPAFDMDRTPVTVAAFAAFVERHHFVTESERRGSSAVMTFGTGEWKLVDGANWRRPTGPGGPLADPTHPVTQVSWNDANAFCGTGGKRLPGEAEWEHAARAGTKGRTAFAFGDELVKDGHYRANVWTGLFPILNTAADGYLTTSPVGAFGAGPIGLTDMAGNVWEWTSDWYRPYAERDQPWDDRPEGEKVQRGGSFLCDPKVCYGFRVTARGHSTPESSHMHVGFRCVRSEA